MATRAGANVQFHESKRAQNGSCFENDLVTPREGFHLKNSSEPRELIRLEPRPTQTALRLRIFWTSD
jgi:hypothetical protein